MFKLLPLVLAALMLSGASACAQDASEPDTNAPRIVPEGWENTYNNFHYAPAVRAGDTLYLSGIVAVLQGEENENNPENLEAAFDRCFEALGKVLEASGADFSQVVEMTTFHTELSIKSARSRPPRINTSKRHIPPGPRLMSTASTQNAAS